MTEITIREASLEDVIGIVYVQATTWIKTYPNEEYKITEADIRSIDFKASINGWQHMIKSPQYGVWVAVEGKHVFGFIAVRQDTSPYELYAMYVLPERQSKGIGKKLMQPALEWLSEKQPLILHIAVYNQPAIIFYKKFGFVLSPPQTQGQVKLPTGVTIQTIQMHREIASQKGTAVKPTQGVTQETNQPNESIIEKISRVQLSRLSGLRESTIKHYTENGLLPFEQAEANLRRYYNKSKALKRLAEVKGLQEKGLTLNEIKEQLGQ